jgi:hypothetical protein
LLAPRQPEPSHRPILAVGLTVVSAAAGIGLLLQRAVKKPQNKKLAAAQALGTGAAVLCLSVALDSAIEHYRGSFKDRLMFAAPSMAAVGLAATAWIAFHPRDSEKPPARVALGAVGFTGLAGLGFHAYNILKRPGELSALNIFYAAPFGAPAALTLAGVYGLIAGERLNSRESVRARLPRRAAGLIALSLLGTVAEASVLHFRGAFQDPFMYAPVVVPPIAAVAIGAAAVDSRAVAAAEPLLKATALLGIAGPMFHAYGIHRNMGGWRNWSQMILQGPPLPAPPAFLGISIAGLGLLPLLEEQPA